MSLSVVWSGPFDYAPLSYSTYYVAQCGSLTYNVSPELYNDDAARPAYEAWLMAQATTQQ